MATETPRFPIGTTFTTRGKHPAEYTVVEVFTTYNSKHEFVRLRYVATREFCGQTLTDFDIVETSIAMGNPKPPKA